ncbi:MAG TPA: hypothetical protein VNQ90_07280 [Chthoniobacteraceae bacterium]|nr:hypothetical protein [Chthoniobacteraceae bacterium]
MNDPGSPLPYRDTKPHGAADFYFAINATFRFIEGKFGRERWIAYLRDLGRRYFEPVNARWRAGGLAEVAAYWRAFFAAEPGGEVEVREEAGGVRIDVRRCPAIAHLRQAGRDIVPFFCEHCHHLGVARAAASGFVFRLEGGNGSCVHRYEPAGADLPPSVIREVR